MINFPHLVWLMGCTCAGKTTFMDSIKDESEIGTVHVGKMMRAKYPPEYFKGQANPEHTQVEAWAMCVMEINNLKDKSLIIIDGQPRSEMQVLNCINAYSNYRNTFILLDAPPQTRLMRAEKKYKDQPGNLELAKQRVTNDMLSYYEVLVALAKNGKEVKVFQTDNVNFTLDDLLTLLSSN